MMIDDDSNMPAFDLIIGVTSMKEFGIILNFKEQVITIDDNTLPMHDITNLPLPRTKDSISTTWPVVGSWNQIALRRQLNAQSTF